MGPPWARNLAPFEVGADGTVRNTKDAAHLAGYQLAFFDELTDRFVVEVQLVRDLLDGVMLLKVARHGAWSLFEPCVGCDQKGF